jgi:hypothetical protein
VRKKGLTLRQTLMALRAYLSQRFLESWLPQNGALFKEHLQTKGYCFGPKVLAARFT